MYLAADSIRVFNEKRYVVLNHQCVCEVHSSHKGREFMPVSFRPSEALWLMQSPTAIISHSFRPHGMNSLFRTKLTLVMIHVCQKKLSPHLHKLEECSV